MVCDGLWPSRDGAFIGYPIRAFEHDAVTWIDRPYTERIMITIHGSHHGGGHLLEETTA